VSAQRMGPAMPVIVRARFFQGVVWGSFRRLWLILVVHDRESSVIQARSADSPKQTRKAAMSGCNVGVYKQ
jgi:hypothetical protein